jgi:hypothetical protein
VIARLWLVAVHQRQQMVRHDDQAMALAEDAGALEFAELLGDTLALRADQRVWVCCHREHEYQIGLLGWKCG